CARILNYIFLRRIWFYNEHVIVSLENTKQKFVYLSCNFFVESTEYVNFSSIFIASCDIVAREHTYACLFIWVPYNRCAHTQEETRIFTTVFDVEYWRVFLSFEIIIC